MTSLADKFVIRSGAGFLGRRSMTGPLEVVGLGFAYTYDDEASAEVAAAGFEGAEIVRYGSVAR